MQIPSNIFLAHLRPSLYLPGCMAIWGVLSTCTGVVHSANSLYATRCLLGVVEAAFYPGALFLISSWYRRSELGLRSAILFSGSQLGSAFSGLIAAGIEHGLNGARGLESWRWIFIIEGSITVFIALCALLVLPDFPRHTRWLSPTERAVAEWRLIKDVGQVDEDDERWSYGFKMAFVDWRLYIFALTFLCIQVSSATTNFFPSVVKTLGFNSVDTLLLTVPPYMVALVVSVSNNWSADRFQNSSFHIMWPLVLAIVGFATAAASTNVGARYFAMVIMIAGGHGANAVLLAWTQKTLLRPRIKRAAAVAFVNAIGNVSQVRWVAPIPHWCLRTSETDLSHTQVFTSYLYPDQDAPRYVTAMSINAAFAVAAILTTFSMRMVLQRANKKLEQGVEVATVMKGEAQKEVAGISNEERLARKMQFRYIT